MGNSHKEVDYSSDVMMSDFEMEVIDGHGIMLRLPVFVEGDRITISQPFSDYPAQIIGNPMRAVISIDGEDRYLSATVPLNPKSETRFVFSGLPAILVGKTIGIRYEVLIRDEWRKLDYSPGGSWPENRVRRLR